MGNPAASSALAVRRGFSCARRAGCLCRRLKVRDMHYEAHQLEIDGERFFDGADATTGRRMEKEEVG